MPTIIGLTELFASLHVAKIHGMKAPHKAVLLLSVIDLVESGSIVETSPTTPSPTTM